MRPHALAALALGTSLLAPRVARADPPRPAPAATSAASSSDPASEPLRTNLAIDLPVTIGAVGLWVTTEALKPELAPSACRWCAVPGIDASVRSALVWHDTSGANAASNVVGFALMPAYAIASAGLGALESGKPSEAWSDLLVVAESTALAMDVNQIVKLSVGRQRPFVHYGPASRPHEPDDDLSFFSGHSTFAAALAASSTTVAILHHRAAWPAIAATGATLALATGYLRIAADKHYLTDVVTGLVVGSAIGIVIPVAFHQPREAKTATGATIMPMTSGTSFGVAGVF